jgi:hypothetical protein
VDFELTDHIKRKEPNLNKKGVLLLVGGIFPALVIATFIDNQVVGFLIVASSFLLVGIIFAIAIRKIQPEWGDNLFEKTNC